jgi:hypothetical protein
MIIRDFYFAAWAIEVKGVGYVIENGKLDLKVSSIQLAELKQEYSRTHKNLFDRVRLLVKLINSSI